jgi:4-nitrophenyl phosphatase
LWHEEKLFLKGVKDTLSYLVHTLNKRVLFVSNNSTTSRRTFTELCHSLGASFITPECFFGSSFATAVYLHDIAKVPIGKKIFVLGQNGLIEELENMGYAIVCAAVKIICRLMPLSDSFLYLC